MHLVLSFCSFLREVYRPFILVSVPHYGQLLLLWSCGSIWSPFPFGVTPSSLCCTKTEPWRCGCSSSCLPWRRDFALYVNRRTSGHIYTVSESLQGAEGTAASLLFPVWAGTDCPCFCLFCFSFPQPPSPSVSPSPPLSSTASASQVAPPSWGWRRRKPLLECHTLLFTTEIQSFSYSFYWLQTFGTVLLGFQWSL